MPLADWIAAHARRTPARVAVRFEDQTLSYGGLAARCEQIAGALCAAGVARGERVAWLGLNCPAMLATLFACARLGAIFMPLNWRLAPAEHKAMLHDCLPAVLCADDAYAAASAAAGIAPAGTRCVARSAAPAGWTRWDAFLAAARPPAASEAAVDNSAPLLLCYTSGSTGRPKGVLLSQDALAANADASVDMHAMTSDDRVLTTLPLFHVGGLNIQTTPALRTGCTVVLHARFDPDAVFDAIERERITLTVLVPAQLDAMIAHPRWAHADLSSLRMISTGSTMVPERLIRTVHARGVPLVLVWGATETAPIAACLHADEAMRKVGSTGRAAAGCELRIVDAAGRDAAPGSSGEILVRGRTVMSGYWRDAPATARALAGGWYHSGDSGHFDDDGYLHVDGRLKDMIISGGENVSPAEVEAVLLECPAVAEAAVVGRADERWGEAVVAVVTAAPGATLTAERVMALFDGRLARFKQPKQVFVVDALPRTALGKVRKEEVRQLVARLGAAAPIHVGRIE
ncbi:MAG: AMP-binding protein [Rubrivivax sp.]|nr:AMP-binding protein [Rubrivivax sp.]